MSFSLELCWPRTVRNSKAFKIVVLFMSITLSLETTYNYKEMEIIDDLPMKMNLEQYLTVLEKTINFVSLHKNLADLNVCFGIYLINGKK